MLMPIIIYTIWSIIKGFLLIELVTSHQEFPSYRACYKSSKIATVITW